jgi:competence protein ComEC
MRRASVAALCLVAAIVCLAAFWGASRARRPLPAPPTPAGFATIEFLDVGQGDAILIRSPEGKVALVDAGPANRIVGQLRDRGIRSIDLVVVSHHHQDHYGGMAAVIRAFHPRVFLDADSPHVTTNYVALLRTVKDEKITAIRAGSASRKIELGSVTLTTFPQAPRDENNENNNSIGIRVEFGAFSALLTGDAEGKERRWWSKNAPELCERVDVLKLAHHGGRDGTDGRWLALTSPGLAVASMAAGNEFGHPHPETVALLGSMGIPFRRTDQDGPIVVRTDGRTFSVGGSTAPTRAGAAEETNEAEASHGHPGLSLVSGAGAVSIRTGRTRRLRRR